MTGGWLGSLGVHPLSSPTLLDLTHISIVPIQLRLQHCLEDTTKFERRSVWSKLDLGKTEPLLGSLFLAKFQLSKIQKLTDNPLNFSYPETLVANLEVPKTDLH